MLRPRFSLLGLHFRFFDSFHFCWRLPRGLGSGDEHLSLGQQVFVAGASWVSHCGRLLAAFQRRLLSRLADRLLKVFLVDDILRVFEVLFSFVDALEDKRVVEILELLPEVGVCLVRQHFFDLFARQAGLLDESRAVVVCGTFLAFDSLWVLSVYDELLESIEHLHPLLVHLGLDYVFQQDELVKSHSEVVPSDHDPSLALDHDCRLHILLVVEIDIEVALRCLQLIEQTALFLIFFLS